MSAAPPPCAGALRFHPGLPFSVQPVLLFFFSFSLLHSYQLSSRAASTSAGSGLQPLSLLVLQLQVGVHLVRCVQFSLALMFRVRCLGSIWGVEVPGHPVLGSLYSPSTWRRVPFGWFPLSGLPWIPPLWLMALLPANLLGTSSQFSSICDEYKCG